MQDDHGTAQDVKTSILQYPFGPDFQAILSRIGDGVISADVEGRIILVNRAAETIFGYASAELLGGSVNALIPMRLRDQHKKDIDGFSLLRTSARRAMSLGREVLGLHKDGSELAVEATLSRQTINGRRVVIAVIEMSVIEGPSSTSARSWLTRLRIDCVIRWRS